MALLALLIEAMFLTGRPRNVTSSLHGLLQVIQLIQSRPYELHGITGYVSCIVMSALLRQNSPGID
eukprot:5311328-Amphidinium_carterae.1